MTGAPLVWFGEVQILEVQNQAFTVLGSVHTPCVGVQDHTALAQLLKNVGGVGLGTTVHHSHLGGPQLLKAMLEQHPERHRYHAITFLFAI